MFGYCPDCGAEYDVSETQVCEKCDIPLWPVSTVGGLTRALSAEEVAREFADRKIRAEAAGDILTEDVMAEVMKVWGL